MSGPGPVPSSDSSTGWWPPGQARLAAHRPHLPHAPHPFCPRGLSDAEQQLGAHRAAQEWRVRRPLGTALAEETAARKCSALLPGVDVWEHTCSSNSLMLPPQEGPLLLPTSKPGGASVLASWGRMQQRCALCFPRWEEACACHSHGGGSLWRPLAAMREIWVRPACGETGETKEVGGEERAGERKGGQLYTEREGRD